MRKANENGTFDQKTDQESEKQQYNKTILLASKFIKFIYG